MTDNITHLEIGGLGAIIATDTGKHLILSKEDCLKLIRLLPRIKVVGDGGTVDLTEALTNPDLSCSGCLPTGWKPVKPLMEGERLENIKNREDKPLHPGQEW